MIDPRRLPVLARTCRSLPRPLLGVLVLAGLATAVLVATGCAANVAPAPDEAPDGTPDETPARSSGGDAPPASEGTGGAAAPPGAGSPAGPDDGDSTIEVTGTLTDEGVECQALRGDDETLYTLTGDLGGFGVGDRVRVRGERAQMSFCMQGVTIAVESIEAAEEG